jgi:predicted PurR-regulated permease PerM
MSIPHELNISTSTILRFIGIVLFLFIAFQLRNLLMIILMSVVIAAAIEPIVRWFAKHKVARVPAVLFVYVFTVLVFGVAIFLFVPPLVEDIRGLAGTLPEQIPWLGPVVEEGGLEGAVTGGFNFQNIADTLRGFPLPENLFEIIGLIFGGVFSFILIIVISFYLSVQDRGVENFLRLICPLPVENYIVGLWKRSERKIGRWLQGQLVLGLIVGILTYIGLTILGVPYALTLALLAALFELIPFFGPILAAVPAVLFGFTDSLSLGLMVIGLYIIIQQLESHVIYPLVVNKIIGVPPIIAIIALLAGGQLGGFLGFILGVPVAVVLMEMLGDFERRKHDKKNAHFATN